MLCSLPLRHTERLASEARPHRGYGPGELAIALDRMPADTEDDISGGDPRVRRRAVLLHRGHQCTVRALESEGLGELRV